MTTEVVKEKIKKYCQNKHITQYYQNKKIKEKYRKKNQLKKQISAYIQLENEDIIYRIIGNLSSRICTELKERCVNRELTYSEFLGCNAKFLKSYIEKKFLEGMTYDNYGEWEVDHIYPISKIDFKNSEEIKQCFYYTNLQPLWKLDNIKKSNKI